MDTKHTDGPWIGQDERGKFSSAHDWYVCDEEARSSEAAPIWADGRVIAFAVFSTDDLYAGSSDFVKANARLIAAAPDLLEACQAADWNSLDLPESVRAQIQAAISKATGAQP